MKIEEYSINKNEQNMKLEDKIELPTVYTVKILDDSFLRLKMERIFEELNQKELAKFALSNAKRFLDYFDDELKNDKRILEAEEMFNKYLKDEISSIDMRKASLVANKLDKESKTEIGKHAARSFAQAIGSTHMRANAIASTDNMIRVINLIHENDIEAATNERKKQLELLNEMTK